MPDPVKTLLPGESFTSDVGVDVTVYPMGVVHLKKFSNQIATAMSIVGRTPIKKGASQKEIGGQIAATLAPFLLTEAMDLIEACVKISEKSVKFDDLPHWDMPKIVELWIEQSFGDEKKWRPWVTAIDRAVTKATGSPFSILEMLSSSSSQLVTPAPTSSTAASPDSPTEDGQPSS